MLEQTALDLAPWGMMARHVVVMGLAGAGALLATAAPGGARREIPRVPYFALSSAALLATSVAGALLPGGSLSAAGSAGACAGAIACVLAGFVYCRAAMARSRDALGQSWGAVLAFLPPANLWLLLRRPRYDGSGRRPGLPWLLKGRAGLLTGLVLLAAAATFTATDSRGAEPPAPARHRLP